MTNCWSTTAHIAALGNSTDSNVGLETDTYRREVTCSTLASRNLEPAAPPEGIRRPEKERRAQQVQETSESLAVGL
jgi:hypothetical protein